MMDLNKFGKVWLASSPLTANFRSIRRAIDIGIDTIVLKATGPNVNLEERKKGRGIIKKGVVTNADHKYFYPFIDVNSLEEGKIRVLDTLFCTSTNIDVEMLTIEEANSLYDQIKAYSRSVKVIQNFAPRKKEDFLEAKALKADAIEFSPRFYSLSVSRPYHAGIWKTLSSSEAGPLIIFPDGKSVAPKSAKVAQEEKKLWEEEKVRREREFKEGLAGLHLNVPLLLKMVREPWDIDFITQLSFPVQGFSYADSQKVGSYQWKDGWSYHNWGKGSYCGEILTENTKTNVVVLRRKLPNTYISASGGIMKLDDALECLDNGANSVQLCSSVYIHGFERAREIVEGIKSKRSV